MRWLTQNIIYATILLLIPLLPLEVTSNVLIQRFSKIMSLNVAICKIVVINSSFYKDSNVMGRRGILVG